MPKGQVPQTFYVYQWCTQNKRFIETEIETRGTTMRHTIKITLLGLALLGAPLTANAQATRTWVSGVGDDANPCSRTAPCKTFAGAISKTAAGGEIDTLDPGGFGAVTITKSITIGTDPSMGGILSSSSNGVVINAAATDSITLRGLTINGAGTGLNGVRILNAGTVNIENCYINGHRSAAPNGVGIHVLNTANFVEVNIDRCTISENGLVNDGAGIQVAPTGSGSAKVSVTRTSLFNNTRGIRGDSSGTTGAVYVTIDEVVATNNTLSGMSILSGAANIADMMITNSRSNLNSSGINAVGALGIARVGGSTITGNASALLAYAPGQIISYGNNYVNGNGTAESFTSTIAPH
jgi:hypothetical protein